MGLSKVLIDSSKLDLSNLSNLNGQRILLLTDALYTKSHKLTRPASIALLLHDFVQPKPSRLVRLKVPKKTIFANDIAETFEMALSATVYHTHTAVKHIHPRKLCKIVRTNI
ncbi:hypothetical protein Avbf_05462 [Armadillidium vulgare]|nr:hypothetical protein Avbf_05462 [Armadillidium vulgare]